MKTKTLLTIIIGLTLAVSGLVLAQTPVIVQRADLAVPFGTASGKLVLVADQLVFVDQDKSEDSFSITRSEIQDHAIEGDMVTVRTRRPLRVRGEEKTQFSFRLREGSSEALKIWATSVSATTASSTPSSTSGNTETEQGVYNVKHSHTVARVPSGSCTGKLIITRDRVVYESLEDREHTRQWPLADIKKIKRNSPYKIEIEPFNQDKYTLEVEGKGIDVSVHKQLMNWISLARQK